MEELFTLGEVCRIIKVQAHIICHLLRTGKVPEPRRIGGRRMFTHADMARISEVLKATVWMKGEQYGQH